MYGQPTTPPRPVVPLGALQTVNVLDEQLGYVIFPHTRWLFSKQERLGFNDELRTRLRAAGEAAEDLPTLLTAYFLLWEDRLTVDTWMYDDMFTGGQECDEDLREDRVPGEAYAKRSAAWIGKRLISQVMAGNQEAFLDHCGAFWQAYSDLPDCEELLRRNIHIMTDTVVMWATVAAVDEDDEEDFGSLRQARGEAAFAWVGTTLGTNYLRSVQAVGGIFALPGSVPFGTFSEVPDILAGLTDPVGILLATVAGLVATAGHASLDWLDDKGFDFDFPGGFGV